MITVGTEKASYNVNRQSNGLYKVVVTLSNGSKDVVFNVRRDNIDHVIRSITEEKPIPYRIAV